MMRHLFAILGTLLLLTAYLVIPFSLITYLAYILMLGDSSLFMMILGILILYIVAFLTFLRKFARQTPKVVKAPLAWPTDLLGNAAYAPVRSLGGGGEDITEVIAALNTPPSDKANIERIQGTLYKVLYQNGKLREYVRDQLVKYIATPPDLKVWRDVKTGKKQEGDLSDSEQRSKRIIDNYLAQRMEK